MNYHIEQSPPLLENSDSRYLYFSFTLAQRKFMRIQPNWILILNVDIYINRTSAKLEVLFGFIGLSAKLKLIHPISKVQQ